MLILEDLHIEYSGIDKIKIQWEFENTSEDLNDYRLDIYRSENPGVGEDSNELDGYELVEGGISLNSTFYLDDGISGIYDPNRNWYYKLVIRNIVNANESIQPDTGSYVRQKLPDYRAEYIVNWKKRALDQYVGRDMTLLKRRT